MGDERSRARRSSGVMYAVLLVLTALFFLSFFNRFGGLRSGAGEYTAGVSFLAGRLPYRDYFTTAPPLNLLKSALLLKIFGEALIVSRAAGALERLLIAAVLFRWLRQVFRPRAALVASLVTIIVSAADRTDPIASYNHDVILWAMLSGLSASLVIEGGRRGWRWGSAAILSGCFAALAILTKQTVGLGSACAVVVTVGVLLLLTEGPRRAAGWVVLFASGCSVPLAAVALVLGRFHLLEPCLDMLFVKGPAAKAAHLSDFMLRELRVGWDNFGWLTLGCFAAVLAGRAIWRSVGDERYDEVVSDGGEAERANLRWVGYTLVVGLGVLGTAEGLRRLPALHDFGKASVYFTLICLTVVLVAFASRLRPGMVSGRRAQCILFCAVAWTVAFTLSLSWPAFEAMTLPGLGFLVAGTIDGARRRSARFVYAALAFVVLMTMREKLDLPFGFDYQDERPVWAAVSASEQPQLRGMRLPGETVHFLDETVRTIRRETRDGETIFVYPELGLLYALSGRTYPTISGSHNIDVLNDRFAAEESDRLLAARPKVIVYYRLSEQQQRDAERLWRNGRPSGQRLLAGAVEALIGGYRLAGSHRLSDVDPEILVYVRR